MRIAQNLNGRFHAGEADLAIDLRQRAAQMRERANREREANRDN